MVIPQQRIEAALDRLHGDTRRSAAAPELTAARAEFFAVAAVDALGERRFAEWFLLERPSAALGDAVPVQGALDGTIEDRSDEPLDLEALAALAGSFPGVFEVTGVSSGEGVWVRDIAGGGEYPLEDPEGSKALELGDLLVGRLFEVGDSLYRISRAAGVFRNDALRDALHKDVERMRASRRGVLRTSQRELERMFWTAEGDAAPAGDPIGDARAVLEAGGVLPDTIEAIFARLRAAPLDAGRWTVGAGDELGAVMDLLAFETGVDLEAARRTLLAAWPTLRAEVGSQPIREPRKNGSEVDVRAAIEAFDAGRAAGRDLDALFADLERDLALDGEDEPTKEEPYQAPDFPGVVAAMVEEFLWETGLERGGAAAERASVLRKFGEFAEGVGVFENLGPRELLTFGSVWLPEYGELGSAADARDVLDALRGFCEWVEERHEIEMLSAYREALAPLEEALPRITKANLARTRGTGPERGELFEVVIPASPARVRDRSGEEHEVEVPGVVAEELVPGDRLRAELTEDGALTVFCCYPGQCARLERR